MCGTLVSERELQLLTMSTFALQKAVELPQGISGGAELRERVGALSVHPMQPVSCRRVLLLLCRQRVALLLRRVLRLR
jgi:hypothetical protein